MVLISFNLFWNSLTVIGFLGTISKLFGLTPSWSSEGRKTQHGSDRRGPSEDSPERALGKYKKVIEILKDLIKSDEQKRKENDSEK